MSKIKTIQVCYDGKRDVYSLAFGYGRFYKEYKTAEEKYKLMCFINNGWRSRVRTVNPRIDIYYSHVTMYFDLERKEYFRGKKLNQKNKPDITEQEQIKELHKQIKAFAVKFVNALQNGEIDVPGPGDCWYCGAKSWKGEPLSDSFKDTDHLLAHMAEDYFVPSLLVNAVAEHGNYAAELYINDLMQHNDVSLWETSADWLLSVVGNALIKYLKIRLGV